MSISFPWLNRKTVLQGPILWGKIYMGPRFPVGFSNCNRELVSSLTECMAAISYHFMCCYSAQNLVRLIQANVSSLQVFFTLKEKDSAGEIQLRWITIICNAPHHWLKFFRDRLPDGILHRRIGKAKDEDCKGWWMWLGQYD